MTDQETDNARGDRAEQEADDARDDGAEQEADEARDAERTPSTAQLAAQGARNDSGDEEPGERDEREPLFAGEDSERFRKQWQEIQGHFVDDPRRAVEEGDALVATLMQQLAETFADERSSLEQQWDREGDVSTEDLRVALQRYRSFFDRLLSA
jgi:hypothetical protein